MDRKLARAIALLIVLAVSAPFAVSAEISIGVKAGDWIEYQVTFTGTPPEGHTVTWARMDVVSVQGKNVTVAVAAKQSDGSWLNETVRLNLEAGQLGDGFVIPANLSSGEIVFDKMHGDLTISGVEERTYAGATRTIVAATVNETAQQTTYQTTYYWDRATGVLVEGDSSYTDFSMYTKMDRTNMWQAQTIGLELTAFYALAIAVAAMLIIIGFLVVRRRK